MNSPRKPTKILVEICALCLAFLLIGCAHDPTHVENGKSPHPFLVGITHYRETIDLTLSKPQRPFPDSPIIFTLEAVSPDRKPRRGYFKVENDREGTVHYGWSKRGEYMHVSPDLGEEGVRLVTLGSNSARLEVSFSRIETSPDFDRRMQP